MTVPAPATMGWRNDPWQRHQVRFFDGVRWTEHVADMGIAGIDTTPVADLERSRPSEAMPEPPVVGPGPHVIDSASPAGTIDDDLLLITGADDDGRRTLLTADDVPVGHVVVPRRRGPARLLALLAVPAPAPPTAMEVRDASDRVVVRLVRPARRIAPTVDLIVPAGPRGSVVASAVRRGLDADVFDAATLVGRLTGPAGRSGPPGREPQAGPAGPAGPVDLETASPVGHETANAVGHEIRTTDGRVLARTSDVWDVPGRRRHIPPGTSLIDRRSPGEASSGAGPDRAREDGSGSDRTANPGSGDEGGRRLLLGALLAPDLLMPVAPQRRPDVRGTSITGRWIG